MRKTKKLKEASAKYTARSTRARRTNSNRAAKVTLQDIDERIRQLPPEKLAVVYDFVSYLLARDLGDLNSVIDLSARGTMFASEAVLERDWNNPAEDKAWAHL